MNKYTTAKTIKQSLNRSFSGGNTMTKTYKIEVDCANCANLCEEAVKKTEGVTDASISFMTQKMKVEFADGSDEKKILKTILKACRRIEPDFEIET